MAHKTSGKLPLPPCLEASEEDAQAIAAAFRSGDVLAIRKAIGTAAKARGMSEIARRTGLSRVNLYKSFGSRAQPNPKLRTLVLVLEALGFRLSVEKTTHELGAGQFTSVFAASSSVEGSAPVAVELHKASDPPSATSLGQVA